MGCCSISHVKIDFNKAYNIYDVREMILNQLSRINAILCKIAEDEKIEMVHYSHFKEDADIVDELPRFYYYIALKMILLKVKLNIESKLSQSIGEDFQGVHIFKAEYEFDLDKIRPFLNEIFETEDILDKDLLQVKGEELDNLFFNVINE